MLPSAFGAVDFQFNNRRLYIGAVRRHWILRNGALRNVLIGGKEYFVECRTSKQKFYDRLHAINDFTNAVDVINPFDTQADFF